MKIRHLLLLLALSAVAHGVGPDAKNVVLFLGDAAGIPTLNAASIYRYNQPRRLFLQNMPNIGLSDTSTASQWVTDSAAGMTAIVTGFKTHNGVISQSASAIRGQQDGAPLKTILEYAEEKGMSTGVITNMSLADATPAACYAHSNDRRKWGEIFAQAAKPRSGNGVEVLIGAGRKRILEQTAALGIDVLAQFRERGYSVVDSLEAIPPGAGKVLVLTADPNLDMRKATRTAIDILSRNGKRFFLMVEVDCHVSAMKRGFDHVIEADDAIRETAARPEMNDSLILFTADHSFDFRTTGGKRAEPLMPELTTPGIDDKADHLVWKNVRREGDHTGEEVLVSAQGPGSERVRGYMANTDIFHIMMRAFGWE